MRAILRFFFLNESESVEIAQFKKHLPIVKKNFYRSTDISARLLQINCTNGVAVNGILSGTVQWP